MSRFTSRSISSICMGLTVALGLSASMPGTALAKCVIYDKRDFFGEFREITPNQSVLDLGIAWNDRTASVRVDERCQLITYEDDNFEGDRRTFRRDSAWVENYWTGRISSARCLCAGRPGQRG